MVNCQNCDSEQSDGSRFCSVCGSPLLGELVYACLSGRGFVWSQVGRVHRTLNRCMESNPMALEQYYIFVHCYVSDLAVGNDFIPSRIWHPTAHAFQKGKSHKISMI